MKTIRIVLKNKILLVVLFLVSINSFGQLKNKQDQDLAINLANDSDFRKIVMSTTFLTLSIGSETDNLTTKMYNEYNQINKNSYENLRSKYPTLSKYSKQESEDVFKTSIELIANEKESASRAINGSDLDKCIDACEARWKKCAKYGWKEGLLIGCTVIGAAAVIAATYLSGGANTPAVAAELVWVRNSCAAALGVITTAIAGACWENYRECAIDCRK